MYKSSNVWEVADKAASTRLMGSASPWTLQVPADPHHQEGRNLPSGIFGVVLVHPVWSSVIGK